MSRSSQVGAATGLSQALAPLGGPPVLHGGWRLCSKAPLAGEVVTSAWPGIVTGALVSCLPPSPRPVPHLFCLLPPQDPPAFIATAWHWLGGQGAVRRASLVVLPPVLPSALRRCPRASSRSSLIWPHLQLRWCPDTRVHRVGSLRGPPPHPQGPSSRCPCQRRARSPGGAWALCR